MTRTAEQHRAALAEWRATAPANDSDIFAPPRASGSPRHAALAEQLQALLDWRALQAAAEPKTSTWLTPANDNDEDTGEARGADCVHEVRPSPDEIMATHARHGLDGFRFEQRPVRNSEARPPTLVRYRSGDRWFRPRERYGAPKGETQQPRSKAHLRATLATQNEWPAERRERPDAERVAEIRSTADEFRARLDSVAAQGPWRPAGWEGWRERAAHYHDAAHLPATTIADDTALPSPDAFISGRVHSTAGAGQQDNIMARRGREIDRMAAAIRVAWVRARLSERHRLVAETAERAQSFADIGRALGYRGKNAERRGKQALLETAEAFRALLDESARQAA